MKPANETIYRPKQAAAALGISLATLWYRLDPKNRRFDPDMPRPFKLSERAVGFKASEISAYINRLAEHRI
ncbi:MAG: AlpA family phage regulatory protein [Neisseria sp.]|uniref:helix-turn-helix transcriptional regulator n=1 Tax=Neisseria sp. TaxID=192066 RepID=UPI0026DAD5E5|nr:AlpA family phage regulatory protein [Neisseria sp.]MDO4640787.1 AlpA family phage regulatory protein [Neisseria sp.]